MSAISFYCFKRHDFSMFSLRYIFENVNFDVQSQRVLKKKSSIYGREKMDNQYSLWRHFPRTKQIEYR